MVKLLKFELPTCGPCKVLSETLNKAKVKYEVIDCSTNMELADKFGISHVPTLVKVDENDNIIAQSREIVMSETLNKFLEDVDTY